jgi:hypothetical protein
MGFGQLSDPLLSLLLCVSPPAESAGGLAGAWPSFLGSGVASEGLF